MTVKEALKTNAEKVFYDHYGKKIIVEFVSDVVLRGNEIGANDKNVKTVYSSTHYTGMFIPETENHCTYILAEDGRSDCDTVITVFHELQHTIDYYRFLSLFDNNQEKMINSNIYYTFQIYSEFMAEQFGIAMFFDSCFTEKDKQEKIKIILDTYIPVYNDFSDVHDKYECIIHSVQYLGILYACAKYDNEFDLTAHIGKMFGLQDLKEIILALLDDYHNFDIEWFQNFDKICREAMQLGC